MLGCTRGQAYQGLPSTLREECTTELGTPLRGLSPPFFRDKRLLTTFQRKEIKSPSKEGSPSLWSLSVLWAGAQAPFHPGHSYPLVWSFLEWFHGLFFSPSFSCFQNITHTHPSVLKIDPRASLGPNSQSPPPTPPLNWARPFTLIFPYLPSFTLLWLCSKPTFQFSAGSFIAAIRF
jgi:hypothetical protein